MKKKWIFILALLAALLLAGCALADTTVMMYMCGTDLYEDCLTDLKEMCKAEYGEDVNVVVLAGGAKKWKDSRLNDGVINTFEIRDGAFSKVTSGGKKSMGLSSTLSDFVLSSLDRYPADRTVLVLWDHGGGSSSGICFDETAGDDSLTVAEIVEALKTVRNKRSDFRLDIVGMDACLMATLEAADALTPYADYLVASEELEPGLGWHYTPWLNALGKNPDMSDEDLCIAIVDAYMEACLKAEPRDVVTLSAVDLRKVEILSEQLESFFEALSGELEAGRLAMITRLRQRLYTYGSFDDASTDMVDLDAFLEAFTEVNVSMARACREALKQCVLYCRKSDTLSVANGLSILIPMDTAGDTLKYASSITDGTLPNLIDFIKAYASSLKSGNYVFASSSVTGVDLSGNTQASSGFFSSLDYVGFVPGYATNAFTEAANSGLPPIAGTGSWTSTQTYEPVPGIPIAGTAGGSTVSPVGVPIAGTATGTAVAGTTVQSAPSFIAGTVGSGMVGLYDTSATVAEEIRETVASGNAYAYSMELTREDLEHLSYVEGQLFMDISEAGQYVLLDLGCIRDAWVDWEKGVAYSLFDGSWPALEGQLVPMIDQSVNGLMRRSLIPARVNGKDTYVVVLFRNGERTGEILGTSEGFDANGLPVRGITPLKEGDEIIPVYTIYYGDLEDSEDEDPEELEFDGDPILWQAGITVNYEPLEPADYLFDFVLNDIYGEYTVSDSISLTIE